MNTADYGDEQQFHCILSYWSFTSLDYYLHIFVNLQFEVGSYHMPYS